MCSHCLLERLEVLNLSAEEQEQERMSSILSSAVDPIVQINDKGTIQMVNNACCQVFKYQDVDFFGVSIQGFLNLIVYTNGKYI